MYCGAETRVINSRPQKRHNHIWRRRQCSDCTAIFTTSEIPDLAKSLVVVRGKTMCPFSRDKLYLSLYDSLKHRKTATSDATGLTDTIISHMYPLVLSGSISSTDIVEIALQVLRHFDKAAATYYQAYHPEKADNS